MKEKSDIKKAIVCSVKDNRSGLQDDWWTQISPDIWNSKGSYLLDISGLQYLDMCGFFSTAPVRYDHPQLRKKSFIEKIGRAAIYRPSLSDFWTREFAEFVQTFRNLATPPYMHHYFFINGGALAVENALKASFDWKVRLNMERGKIKEDPQEQLQPLGTKIICFENCFHGRSGYTLSLTHTSDPRKYKYFPKFDWYRIEPPVLTFDSNGNVSNEKQVEEQHRSAVEKLREILEKDADNIAAIIIEPIQCEGGDRHIPIEFFSDLRRLTEEFDVILIYDEVQTGFGATGKMWAHQYFSKDAIPDIVVFSKKSQVGGLMANKDKFSIVEYNVFGNHEECKSRLNSTWGGNPVDMVRSSELLKIIDKENLLENARGVGSYLLKGIQQLCKQFPDIIENPRGRGMIIGFDLKNPEKRGSLWQLLYEERMLCLLCGSKTVRLRPHLDLTEKEAEEALSILKRALKKM